MKLPIAKAEWGRNDPHGMHYDNPQFWDAPHMESELHRVFEICNGCRLCFNLCPSFDVLFKRIDALDPHREEAEGMHLEGGVIEEHEAAKLLEHVKVSTENPVNLLKDEDNRRVVELCYECKLCFPKCPYVPPHEFAVDFPKLMLRSKMIWAKEDGLAFREKFLGATDLVGTAMTKIAPFANAAAHNKFNRTLMEQTVGIHRDRQLPKYADESFETWWARRAPRATPDGQDVAVFFTCYVNYNDPAIAQDAVAVLEKAGCNVDCPEQNCCGMPKLDGGDIDGARRLAQQNVEKLLPSVRAGKKIVSPGPSCTLMLKTEYPELVGTPEAKEVAEAVMDMSDYVLQLGRAKKLPKPPPGAVGKVAFHVACHNRVQNLGYKGRDLLKWAGGDTTLVDRCCGMDGTWGMKKEFFAESLKVAKGAADRVDNAEPDTVSSDCPLAGLQIRQMTSRPVFHPVRILKAAYEGEPLRSPKKDVKP